MLPILILSIQPYQASTDKKVKTFVLFICNDETVKFAIIQINIKHISYQLCYLQATVLPVTSECEVMFCFCCQLQAKVCARSTG